ncbi:Golgin subfamily B member 1 372 kDa Golgi complex-associated protein [Channa argus]|uniref:Golgin subfamily B member 1 372 kDa Golgi complex-associated protein n=1 Tax=Channa argus TaxID=215402 RepID=A0A6G1QRI2_CHAAH|nr:Golgin subfamily B member 1 372 kDa Golgi complex-associated protein [Channa argus]
MFSRLATVLQELSGEEDPDGDSQGMLVPQLSDGEVQAPLESEIPEEAMERLAHLEQLVVQLKELIRDKDNQLVQKDTELANKDGQLKNEKEEAEARFTKLKLQAKAKMAALNKQITDLKGQGAIQSPDSSFTGAGVSVEEELQELKKKLSDEEAKGRELKERLQATEQLLQEKESANADQLKKLQAVIFEKDVRFQEQIQKHEEELMKAAIQSQNDSEFQKSFHAAQRRCEELEEALNSRSQVLEMLQEEISSSDQQKQILTAQFRQMEQDLAEALKLREEERKQWAEQASRTDVELAALRTSLEGLEGQRIVVERQENELFSLRDAERNSQEALQKEKMEVARLERELALMKEAEVAATQVSLDAVERDRAEIARLESELASMREAAVHANQYAPEKEKSEVDKLEKELASLKKQQEEAQKKSEILAEIWRHLQSVALEDAQSVEENPIPADLSLLLDTVQAVEMKLTRLKDEHSKSEQRYAELSHTMETLQEQLNRQTTEQDESTAKIQQLEQQIITMSEESLVQPEQSVQASSEADKAHILVLEQQLLAKDSELAALQESLRLAKDSSSEVPSAKSLEQDQDSSVALCDSSAGLQDWKDMEDTQEEETTLLAENTSVLSLSADNESSPELIGHHSESPEESKGTSSDEMVASSDSEVVHNSWTLLEAVNQDGSQEWPSIVQDLRQLQMQSWEATSMEQETSTVQVESSSVIIKEAVQVHLTQQSSSSTDANVPSGQVFAQALAEELQKRYSELLSEVQQLREEAAESQEKIKTLEENTQFLTATKEEAELQARNLAEELQSAKEELDKVSQQSSSVVENHHAEMQLLQEQNSNLNTDTITKENKIQALQTDLEMAQQALSEQEGQARMLSAQLEDREFLSSELERRLQNMESSLLEYSQASDLNNETLSKKDSEISELQLRLNQKEKEMMELTDSMSARLLQAEEEKFQIDGEVSKLREQLVELEKVRDEKQQASCEDAATHADDELGTLRKEKGELETQLTNAKKKLQAALVQRKELMKKVADFELEAKRWKEKVDTTKEETPEVEKRTGCDIQHMEAKLLQLEQTLKSKEETVESLEQKINQQDQVIAEMLTLNKKLIEEAENTGPTDSSSESTVLQSQVVSLEAECETLHKKVQEAQESRKETIRKAKEKDRHHREQLKQQKEEYNELMERFEVQSGERDVLLCKLSELENKMCTEREDLPHQETKLAESLVKQAEGDWAQAEDWVDFSTSEPDSSQQQSSDPAQHPAEQSSSLSAEMEESLKGLRDEIQTVKTANIELEKKLQETQAGLSQKEAEVLDLGKELQALRDKERQIDALSEEIIDLRKKHRQAESYAENLKAEMETAAKAASVDSASSIAALQAEVEDFKQFLDKKNQEIMELSQQLSEQNSLIHSMQDTVSQKDQLITSLQEELRLEQDKTQKLEAEVPQKQEEEKDSETKIQQLQRKLQAALISRKETLKENKTQKEQLASTEALTAELKQKIESAGEELEKLKIERVRLIEEVDRTLLENQSLGSSCESLKLAMEGILNEKDACKQEVELAKEEAARISKEWEEKVQSMKDEYETLLKSYENVSDEAERVRRVLEAARQERQELAAKVRTHEAARQEAERQAEEAQKEIDLMKDKMRKFAKTKQQKILELEEENERLRELQEKPITKREDRTLKAEAEQLQEELQALKAELDATTTEKDSLVQQIEELKEQLAEVKKNQDNKPSLSAVTEELVTVHQSDTIITTAEPPERYEEEGSPLTPNDDQIAAVSAPQTHLQPTGEKENEETMENAQTLLDKINEMEAAFNTEKEVWQEQEAELKAELASLKQDLQENKDQDSLMASLEKCLQDSKDRENSLIEESSKRETQFKELLKSLETEKDNLEERLMNQLAQLNGSIAGYQQEAAENRGHLAELQREVERLERERAELEAEAQCERDRAARLEEDMRQAQRERAEAEAESGKQRELEQQLRSAQRVKEGSQSRARQLEELLREKQLEVRQLQKESIQYQERISELGKEAKTLQLAHNELCHKLEQSQLEANKTLEDLKRTEVELASCKSQLDVAQKQLSEALAEKTSLENSAQQKEALIKAEAEQTLDSVRFRLGAELKEMEHRLEEAYRDREKEEEATLEAREIAEGAEKRAQTMQARLDESLARLAAFSRCMSSLQDDRDRVLDETRQWETRFNDALQSKEAEVQKAETRAKELAEQLQAETALKEDLKLSVDRLENADKDWQLRMGEEEKKVKEGQALLEEERRKLQQTVAELQSKQTEVRTLTDELEALRHRAQALEDAVGKLQGEVDQARTELKEKEAEERRLYLNVEQLDTDLRSSKALTESLQTELNEKERREVEMLGEKEQAVAQAADEARKEADSRAQEAEKEAEQRRGELRDLEEKFRKVEEESTNWKAKLDSFMKAMGSLQDDRDRVLNMYKQLEEKHLQVMMEKDGLIQEAAGENNSLKEEIRSLLVQRDDLYAEKAKLSAQLHGYRDELNQVLSMKDSQHKQLLAAQRAQIASLEKERTDLESQLKSVNRARDTEVETGRVERETLSQAADGRTAAQVIDAPGAEVEKLREKLQAARQQVEALEESLHLERQEHERKSKELSELQWEGGVMRTESESAQERVAELARDLLAVEQKLLEEKEVTTQLRAENQSFAKAMASLQDSRDQAMNKTKELSQKLEEMNRAGGQVGHSSPGGSTGEVWSLKNALQALQNDRERLLEQLQTQTSELKRQKSELARLGAGELIKISQELFEEKKKNEDMLGVITQLESVVETGKQEVETLRLERIDWMAQVEQLKQQTLATLSERDQQLRHLTAMLEEAHIHRPKLQQEHYQRQAADQLDSAPGAPQERSSPVDSRAYMAEVKELQCRLDEETQQRMAAEEQLMATQDRLKRLWCYIRNIKFSQLLKKIVGSLKAVNFSYLMWKSVVGHNVSVKVATDEEEWETDPDFENDVSEQEQRWGAKTIEGSGRKEHIR